MRVNFKRLVTLYRAVKVPAAQKKILRYGVITKGLLVIGNASIVKVLMRQWMLFDCRRS